MKYHYQYGIIKDKKGRKGLKIATFMMLFLVVGGYVGFLSVLPAAGGWVFANQKAVTEKVRTVAPGVEGDQLYIPKINVQLSQDSRHATFEGDVNNSLRVTAPALSLQITPRQTLEASPFARLGQLRVGDEIFIDQGDTRYAYRITDKKDTATLQLSSSDASQKVFAEKIGVIAWTNAGPTLQLPEEE
ncbi:MAG TPA: hypothetical protein VD907_01040 [Verrucomicrobiae bacterium]|nr:hypothetical protein [Verrucomicrobiae bacterium]